MEAHVEPAHVGYYFGALLGIGAMGWFMTNAGIRFGAGSYSQSPAAMHSFLCWWEAKCSPSSSFEFPLDCSSPSQSERLRSLSTSRSGSSTCGHLSIPAATPSFILNIDASWVLMEIATILASAVALRHFFHFHF